MKKIIYIIILIPFLLKAQSDTLNYKKIPSDIKKNIHYNFYITKSGTILKIGDTLTLGIPSGGQLTQSSVLGGRLTNNIYKSIMMGKFNFDNIVFSKIPGYLDENFKGEKLVVSDIELLRAKYSISRRPTVCVILENNGRNYNLARYRTAVDYESSIEIGELINNNEPMSKNEALLKLKEAKERLDLQLIKQDEYNKIKEDLLPFINKN